MSQGIDTYKAFVREYLEMALSAQEYGRNLIDSGLATREDLIQATIEMEMKVFPHEDLEMEEGIWKIE